MTKAERLKLLQARLAKLRLKQAELPAPVASPGAAPAMFPQSLPPIRIELAVKALTDGSKRDAIPLPG
jgi:hypothetical protein